MRPARVAIAVHSGMIAAPLAEFAAHIRRTPGLQQFEGQGERYRRAAKAEWDAHTPEIRRSPADTWVWLPRSTPARYDGSALPHNQALALARLGLALDDRGARQTAAEIFRIFASDVRIRDKALEWTYFPTRSSPFKGYEAAAQVSEFLRPRHGKQPGDLRNALRWSITLPPKLQLVPNCGWRSGRWQVQQLVLMSSWA